MSSTNGSRDKGMVLVTGGGGYLGSVLVPMLLDQGYRVRVLDLFLFGEDSLKSCQGHAGLQIIREDVFHHDNVIDLFQDVYSVIHLASLSNDPSCDLDPNLSIRTNFLATLSFARRAKHEGVRRFIFASSCSVYGAQGDQFLTEESRTEPVTLYALSKLECERELKRLSSDDFVIGLPRLATLFGYSQRMRFDLAVNVMVKRALTKEGLVLNGEGKQYRPFLHVRDAAGVFIHLLEADRKLVNGEIYNVGSPSNNYTIAGLAREISSAFPGTQIKQIQENTDSRSYRISFKKYENAFGTAKLPSRKIADAIEEIRNAWSHGQMKDMNDPIYYNVLVVKNKSNGATLPNMALPSLANSHRWHHLSSSGLDSKTIQQQAMASCAQAKKLKVIGIILAYQCEKMLPRALSRIPMELLDELIVMDDCSKDGTAAKARELGLTVFSQPKNLGYGGNLKAGLKIAFERGADYVVEIHGDGAQFNPISIKYALPLMESGYDLILGSRFIHPMKALRNGMPLIRFFANRFLSFFDRIVLKLPLTEFHTGFRIYGRRLHETVPTHSTSNDYLYSFQVIAQAAYHRMKVGEVEVEADYINEHTSHKVSGAAVYAIQTFGILFNFLCARMGIRFTRLFPKILREEKQTSQPSAQPEKRAA